MRFSRHRRFLALLLVALWVPFYAHCALEAHCKGACSPVEHSSHDGPCDGECPHDGGEHCHKHDFTPAPLKSVVPPLLVVDFPAWMVAALVIPAVEPDGVVAASARAPDESPPPHLAFTVNALPVRGPSIA